MRALKYSVVTLLLFAGVAFFYAGMGIEIRDVEFKYVTSFGAPLGIAFIVLAVLLAGFWREPPTSNAN